MVSPSSFKGLKKVPDYRPIIPGGTPGERVVAMPYPAADGGGQDHPTAADSEEEAGPAVSDSPAGDGGAAQVHTYAYIQILVDRLAYRITPRKCH